MLNLLLSGEATANKGSSIWVYVILIVLVVAMLVLPTITNRRRMKEYNTMLDQLRVGDEIRTIGGVVGRVTKINTKGEIKTFVLETGAKGSKTTMEFDMAAVGTVLKSTYVAPATEENKKAKKEEKTENKEENNAEVKEMVEEQTEVEAKEEVKNEEVKEEKPVQNKPASKKATTAKKATTKKSTKTSK